MTPWQPVGLSLEAFQSRLTGYVSRPMPLAQTQHEVASKNVSWLPFVTGLTRVLSLPPMPYLFDEQSHLLLRIAPSFLNPKALAESISCSAGQIDRTTHEWLLGGQSRACLWQLAQGRFGQILNLFFPILRQQTTFVSNQVMVRARF